VKTLVRAAVVTLFAATLSPLASATVARASTPAPPPPVIHVPLPYQVTDMVVDNTHRQLFVATRDGNDGGAIVVIGFDGTVEASIPANKAGSLAITPDDGTVYAAEPAQPQMLAINTATLGVTTIDMGTACPWFLAYAGGKVWFTTVANATCVGSGIGSYDPTSGAVSPIISTYGARPELSTLPNDPNALVLNEYPTKTLVRLDVSGSTPSVAASISLAASCQLSAGPLDRGTEVGVYCQLPDALFIYRSSDLAAVGQSSTPVIYGGFAESPDGRYIATLGSSSQGSKVAVMDAGAGLPDTLVHTYSIDGEAQPVLERSIAWSDSGLLFALVDFDNIEILTDPSKYVPAMSLTLPPHLAYGAVAVGSGNLGFAPTEPTTVSVTRTDSAGTKSIGAVSVGPDGSFQFSDASDHAVGTVTYAVSYAGDDSHTSAGISDTTVRESLPYDFNGDGHADLAIGVPKEDDGSVVDAGAINIIYGHAVGHTAPASQYISQNSAGVPGASEKGDEFGYAQASGDFNGDGYADLAVSAPFEDVGTTKDEGAVWIFLGSPTGLQTTGSYTLGFDDTLQSDRTNFDIGYSLAAGDLGKPGVYPNQADGLDDLVIGAPGLGAVLVSYGSTGRMTTGSQLDGIGEGDGTSVAVGDINGDGVDDVVAGAPGYQTSANVWGGAVMIVLSNSAEVTTGVTILTKASAGVPGSPHGNTSDLPDSFGQQVALGDFNGDGKADLVVGAPGSPVTTSDGVKHEDAGTVTVLYSNGSQISTAGAVEITQSTPGVPGSPGKGDQLGNRLAAGDTNGDGIADLAMFSPGDRWMTVIPGAKGGLDFARSAAWNQSSPGIVGTDTIGDRWGGELRFVAYNGIGPESLMVGAPGKNAGAGSVTLMNGAAAGLTGSGSLYFDQNSVGVPGTAEKGDAFGTF
jgi:hypothetical protein